MEEPQVVGKSELSSPYWGKNKMNKMNKIQQKKTNQKPKTKKRPNKSQRAQRDHKRAEETRQVMSVCCQALPGTHARAHARTLPSSPTGGIHSSIASARPQNPKRDGENNKSDDWRCEGFGREGERKKDGWILTVPDPLFPIFLWRSASFGLPQVVVDGQGVHADRHSLGRDDGELLAVRVVLVELVDHLLADALGACARQLEDLLRVREVGVERSELAAAVTEQDDQVIGLALVQLLARTGREMVREQGEGPWQVVWRAKPPMHFQPMNDSSPLRCHKGRCCLLQNSDMIPSQEFYSVRPSFPALLNTCKVK